MGGRDRGGGKRQGRREEIRQEGRGGKKGRGGEKVRFECFLVITWSHRQTDTQKT